MVWNIYSGVMSTMLTLRIYFLMFLSIIGDVLVLLCKCWDSCDKVMDTNKGYKSSVFCC